MTPRARVEAALRGEMPDKVPFTVYESKIPQCAVERQLRNEGLCIVVRTVPVVNTITPNVTVESHIFTQDGVRYTRTIYHTPVGDLSTLTRPAGFTSWHVEKIFKTPEDYKPLLFLIQDRQFLPNYAAFERAQADFGEDGFFRGAVGSTPLHEIMVSMMGVETFAIEWVERRDEIMKLYDALVEKLRSLYPLLADSPALAFNYGGNETADVMGRERFEKYVAPHYDEAAEVLHKKGKLLGAHLDGNNRVWADIVARSGLDYIEAFTPAPDTDMSMADAREVWADKVLWINYPSSVHLASIETIEETTRQILRDAAPGDRLLVGITEDVPENRWRENFLAISRVLDTDGRTPVAAS
ncbi:MAG TPA: uroporphyrinogen decarboxylase family protein [Armatimonadota bacterium]|nr:hypothetical protein [Armatimonadota bacterium]HPT97238.1 uroporphyrinogen decarboxylase family protein [Armatimonadota bacterium]